MKKISILLILFVVFSCKKESKFNLRRDIYDFSNKMENSDTLVIRANLSACLSSHSEKLILIKKQDKIHLSNEIDDDFFGEKKLKNVIYNFNSKDTLNLENLFLKVRKDTILQSNQRYFIQAIYKRDTISFTTQNLSEKLMKGGHFGLIMRRLYPNEEVYQPIKLIRKIN